MFKLIPGIYILKTGPNSRVRYVELPNRRLSSSKTNQFGAISVSSPHVSTLCTNALHRRHYRSHVDVTWLQFMCSVRVAYMFGNLEHLFDWLLHNVWMNWEEIWPLIIMELWNYWTNHQTRNSRLGGKFDRHDTNSPPYILRNQLSSLFHTQPLFETACTKFKSLKNWNLSIRNDITAWINRRYHFHRSRIKQLIHQNCSPSYTSFLISLYPRLEGQY